MLIFCKLAFFSNSSKSAYWIKSYEPYHVLYIVLQHRTWITAPCLQCSFRIQFRLISSAQWKLLSLCSQRIVFRRKRHNKNPLINVLFIFLHFSNKNFIGRSWTWLYWIRNSTRTSAQEIGKKRFRFHVDGGWGVRTGQVDAHKQPISGWPI